MARNSAGGIMEKCSAALPTMALVSNIFGYNPVTKRANRGHLCRNGKKTAKMFVYLNKCS